MFLESRLQNPVIYRKEYLQLIGKTDTYKYKVALLADETGGIYNMIKHRGIHRSAAEVQYPNLK